MSYPRLSPLAIALFTIFSLCGCAAEHAGSISSKAPQKPPAADRLESVQEGDLVRVDYSVFLEEDGSLVRTTLQGVAENPGYRRAQGYQETGSYSPEEIVAGQKAGVPGLADAVLGMTPRERKRVILPPEKAYGLPDPEKRVQFPCVRTIPRIINVPVDEFIKMFGLAPEPGKEVNIIPHVTARVIAVSNKQAVIEFSALDGERAEGPFGSTLIRVGDQQITLTLTPEVGAVFTQKNREGKITDTDGSRFTVDFNSPLAGKAIALDLQVVSLTKPPAGSSISWLESHEQGLEEARREGKPVVLVLYADWCNWCKKLFNETIRDPRIAEVKDRFVWVRIDSNRKPRFREMYGQRGYPMIVFLGADGKVMGKIRSFVDGGTFRKRLDDLLRVLEQS